MLVLSLNCPDAFGCRRPFCSATDVTKLFYEWGHRAFANKSPKAFRPTEEITSANGIEDMFHDFFGDALLRDSLKPTLVTAFDLTMGQPFFLNSAKVGRDLGSDVLMWQAARATTAVTTHFAPFRLPILDGPFGRAREAMLVDGSLFATNPAMCALAEARSLFPQDDDWLLLSLGCGHTSQKSRRRISDFSLTAQSACVDYQMRAFLPPKRYIRIQPDLTRGLDRIDDASEQNLRALQNAAQETIARNEVLLDQLADLLAPSLALAIA
jgi:patatin-like phospholipase/acyl hydrolase